MKKAMDMRSVQIKLLKQERETANERVMVERKLYCEELLASGYVTENQMDPVLLAGYSSDIASTRASSVTAESSVHGEADDNEEGNGEGSKTPVQED